MRQASSSPGIVVITTMKPTTVQFTVAQNDIGKVIERVNSGAQLAVTSQTGKGTRVQVTAPLEAHMSARGLVGTLWNRFRQRLTRYGRKIVPVRPAKPQRGEAIAA